MTDLGSKFKKIEEKKLRKISRRKLRLHDDDDDDDNNVDNGANVGHNDVISDTVDCNNVPEKNEHDQQNNLFNFNKFKEKAIFNLDNDFSTVDENLAFDQM